jgi:hypothetical protein
MLLNACLILLSQLDRRQTHLAMPIIQPHEG